MPTLRACVVGWMGVAAAVSVMAQPLAEMSLPSCVAGSPGLRVPVATERATLDARDRQRFEAAAQARYPLYQRSGATPWQVLLLRRGGQWQYVTLWKDGRGSPCFAAVFAADRFDFTAEWVAKYQPQAQAPAD
ncbi:MAG: hypothetical protein QM722_23300 [Piscinibacter sp.]